MNGLVGFYPNMRTDFKFQHRGAIIFQKNSGYDIRFNIIHFLFFISAFLSPDLTGK